MRRAVALTLDRPKLVQGLMKGRAKLGNDSPFASVLPMTDGAGPQHERNIAEAKALMAAGMANGFDATLATSALLEIPSYAVLVQNAGQGDRQQGERECLDQGAAMAMPVSAASRHG